MMIGSASNLGEPNFPCGPIGADAAAELLIALLRQRSARQAAPPTERTHPKDGSVLVFVPPGTYALGSRSAGDERPEHRVRLSGYWIGKFPITQRQYAAFVRETSHRAPELAKDPRYAHPEQPVVGVSWADAVAYAAWAGLVLPSEAQWEAAARGKDGRAYPWGNELPTRDRCAWNRRQGPTSQPSRVGSFALDTGPFGTKDQAGNVWEWCRDGYDSEAYAKRSEDAVDPVVTRGVSPSQRVARGGSYYSSDFSELRASYRRGGDASSRFPNLGFRCAKPA